MFYLYSLSETFTNGYKIETIDIITLLAILCGILVIISKNPIVSVLFLIGLFSSISCYLILLGLTFIGLSYLLVYVGAVSILFLFILMLINVRISELLSDTSKSIPLAIIVVVSFSYSWSQILPYSISVINNYFADLKNILYEVLYRYNVFNIFSKLSDEMGNSRILLVTSNAWECNLSENNHITSIGNIMYTSHSMWLIITSIILLLAMVGAIVITKK